MQKNSTSQQTPPIVIFLQALEARAMFGNDERPLPHSTFHAQQRVGELPPPIKLSARTARYLKHEYEAVRAARVAGKSSAEIRALVAALVAARTATKPEQAPQESEGQ